MVRSLFKTVQHPEQGFALATCPGDILGATSAWFSSGCDDPEVKEKPDFDRHQLRAVRMGGYDGVSGSGQEIYNLLATKASRTWCSWEST